MNNTVCPLRTEFVHNEPDNMLLIENRRDGVVIRAARDNFSERRKRMFIREMAAEGFIPDEYEQALERDETGLGGVRWVIDTSWVEDPSVTSRRINRAMFPLVTGILLAWAWLAGIMFLAK